MKAALIIAERELRAFFTSSLAYVLLVVWLLYQGMVFSYVFFSAAGGGMGSDGPLPYIFGGESIFFHMINFAYVPALTMRSVADEYRTGNIDAVLSTPVTEWSFLLGKWLAAVAMWLALWVPTLIYVWLTSRFGLVDAGAVLASYLGIIVVGLGYAALGVFASTLAKTQLTAFLFGFMLVAGLFILGIFSFVAEPGTAQDAASYVSVWEHISTFTRGIVVSLFVSHRILVARRLA